jgi:hypothetical protein
MRRVILFAAVVGLSFTAVAFGSTKAYTGNATSQHCGEIEPLTCIVALDGKFESGKVEKVVRFSWQGIPAICDTAGTTLGSNSYPPPMSVSHQGDFSGHFKVDGQTVDIDGGFSKNYKNVGGTLRVQAVVSGGRKCDTGSLKYHVVRLTAGN